MADLTTVTRYKAFVGVTVTTADALYARLIRSESRVAEQWCGRSLSGYASFSARLNGTGTSRLVLPKRPILEVASLTIGSATVQYNADGNSPGFSFDDTCLYLAAERFPYIPQSVACEWTAGWRAVETQVIPTGNTPTITPYEGLPVAITSVVEAVTNVAFTANTANTPAAGEYYFNAEAGTLVFNTADAGKSVVLTYGYVPADVEQAVIEMIALDVKQRDNIGVRSKTLGNESISYDDRGMTPSAKAALENYRSRVPM